MKSRQGEATLAEEFYNPSLSEYYKKLFDELLKRLSKSLYINRVEIIKKELDCLNSLDVKHDLEFLKYQASLNVLIDLSQQGWVFNIKDSKLYLKMENDNIDDKAKMRYRLSAERNAQFKQKSVAEFIKRLENPHEYKGEMISIKNLIGNKELLINSIKNNKDICSPYVQLVKEEKDEYTGFKLSEIWRYFRYTWAIPYKTMPGRNLFYLVRDSNQPYHPVIGIFALGNSVLNLTVRDDDIGWTYNSIKKELQIRTENFTCEQIVSGTEGKTITTKVNKIIETEKDYQKRIKKFAEKFYPLLCKTINNAIKDIYQEDITFIDTENPTKEQIEKLLELKEKYRNLSINNKNNEKNPDWKQEAKTNLFRRKRCAELAKLLKAKATLNETKGKSKLESLENLINSKDGKQTFSTALIANRKIKIGSNMMDIIVCGAIPPYNELLGGKLTSIVACSPQVIRDYTKRYSKQISEIASRMKGKKVIRDSQLVYLGTTSLYSIGSSQYNRIKVPMSSGLCLKYREMGITEGFGTVFFSKETTESFSNILTTIDGGKRINHVFGEGTSPRFRMISRGLGAIGIQATSFLKHYSPRIVYSMDLAKNTKEYLMGYDKKVEYGFDLNDEAEVMQLTQEMIDFWKHRWLEKRLTTVDIIKRLEDFDLQKVLLSNYL